VWKALELIDMREQTGAHPRLGAVDVVPFIPLGRTKMNDAVTVLMLSAKRFMSVLAFPYIIMASRHEMTVGWHCPMSVAADMKD